MHHCVGKIIRSLSYHRALNISWHTKGNFWTWLRSTRGEGM